MSNRVHGMALLSSWNKLDDDITLNSLAVNEGQLDIYLPKCDEQVKTSTTAMFLHNIERMATFWNRYS